MKRSLIVIPFLLAVVVLLASACGSKTGTNRDAQAGKTIKAAPVGNLLATLSSESGVLKRGHQELTLSFTDASGKPVDVGAVSLTFHMK